MALKTPRDLDVWKKAVDCVEEVYKLTRDFPDDEKFGLTGQMRRAAVSIPANIAEGYGRTHRGDYLRHLSYARGSLAELETHLIIAVRLELTTREAAQRVWPLLQDIGKMLIRLIASLQQKKGAQPEPEPRDPEPDDYEKFK